MEYAFRSLFLAHLSSYSLWALIKTDCSPLPKHPRAHLQLGTLLLFSPQLREAAPLLSPWTLPIWPTESSPRFCRFVSPPQIERVAPLSVWCCRFLNTSTHLILWWCIWWTVYVATSADTECKCALNEFQSFRFNLQCGTAEFVNYLASLIILLYALVSIRFLDA